MDQPDQAISAIAKLSRRPQSSLINVPGDKGLPVIGHSLQLMSDAPSFMQQRYAQYGPVFKMSAFGILAINFASVDAARLILLNRDKNFSSQLGWWRVTGLLQRGILLRNFSDHRGHRLNQQLSDGLNQWPKGSLFHFQPRVKSLLLDNAASLSMGAELRARVRSAESTICIFTERDGQYITN